MVWVKKKKGFKTVCKLINTIILNYDLNDIIGDGRVQHVSILDVVLSSEEVGELSKYGASAIVLVLSELKISCLDMKLRIWSYTRN